MLWGIKMDKICDIASLILTVLLVREYVIKKVNIYKSKNHYLNQQQVMDNIRNNRRYDWGTGQEENWQHAWNPANPTRNKGLEIFGIIIKSILLFLVLAFVTRILMKITVALIIVLLLR